MRRIVCALSLALALAPSATAGATEPVVILISLDGTTPEAVRGAELETIPALVRRGLSARRLTPVFPTNTFPNHVTLVTGVEPETHGIVNNAFVDPERGVYRYEADPTWLESEPLWSLVEAQGIVSAAFHWVGSEGPWRSGRGPTYWKPFDDDVAEAEKVDQILAWLDLEERRPRLVTVWFHGGDHAGHRFGPEAPEVSESLRRQDRELGRLVAGLEERGLWPHTTLLLVSDHGMAEITRRVDLGEALDEEGVEARLWGGGGFTTVTLERPQEDLTRAVDIARALGLEAHPRGRAPGLRTDHVRFGDMVVLAPVGTALGRFGALQRLGEQVLPSRFAYRGSHGYHPREPSMGALFVAFGRAASRGARVDEVRAVDIAPTVLGLLGVPIPDWMEGKPVAELAPAPASALRSVREGVADP